MAVNVNELSIELAIQRKDGAKMSVEEDKFADFVARRFSRMMQDLLEDLTGEDVGMDIDKREEVVVKQDEDYQPSQKVTQKGRIN